MHVLIVEGSGLPETVDSCGGGVCRLCEMKEGVRGGRGEQELCNERVWRLVNVCVSLVVAMLAKVPKSMVIGSVSFQKTGCASLS